MIDLWQRAAALAAAFLFSVVPLSAGLTEASASTEPVKLRVQLIWGTNDDQSPDASHKALAEGLRKKLSGIFKWKNYFEVKQQVEAFPVKTGKKLKLSPQCEVDIRNLGNGMIAAKLFGEGKFLFEQRVGITSKEPVVLGGHDKNKTAWFVVITPL